MDIRNCSRCGKVFRSMGRKICPECVQEEEREFQKVRDYVREHRDANIPAVSEATGVAAERINQFIREGRLVLATVTLECMSCGAPIEKGRFCQKCLEKMSRRARLSSREVTPESPSEKQSGHKSASKRGSSTAPRFYSIQGYFERRGK